MTTLANRLAVYACHDLVKFCPKTVQAMAAWLDQAGFWLAELASCAKTPDQAPFMIGLLGLALAPNMGVTFEEAKRVLIDEMALRQAQRMFSKEAI